MEQEIDRTPYSSPKDWHNCLNCVLFAKIEYGPSHNGSKGCQCGSIASGGTVSHCSCSTCF
jgi:hypothetical protein